MLPFGELVEWDLDTARKQALEQRPELRGARLQTKIAELDVRREHAKYIPDLSLQVSYLGFQNVNFLPQSAGTVGFALSMAALRLGIQEAPDRRTEGYDRAEGNNGTATLNSAFCWTLKKSFASWKKHASCWMRKRISVRRNRRSSAK